MTHSVQLHGHDVLTVPLTVLLYCPITGTTRTLSYWCSNRAGSDQTRSRTLLELWLIHLHFENDEFFKRCCCVTYQCWMVSVALANFSRFKIEMNQWKHFNIPSSKVATAVFNFLPSVPQIEVFVLGLGYMPLIKTPPRMPRFLKEKKFFEIINRGRQGLELV